MKFKKTKWLSYVLAAALLFQSAGMTAMADTTDASSGMAVEYQPPEENKTTIGPADYYDPEGTEDTSDLVTIEDVLGTETPLEQLFPGLPESYEMSAAQVSAKQLLADHSSGFAIGNMEDDLSLYAAGEIVYLTDTEEDAQIVATAFGGTLKDYAEGVAVITLSDEVTVIQAVMAAASEAIPLPAVWPNYYKELYYNDPALSEASKDYQWQHNVVGDTYAWAAGYTGKNVKVAVLDTGILNSHEEFSGRLVQHLNMTNTSAPAATTDAHGHGTHVSGIIAGNLNNKKGGSGIAPDASLYVYTIANADGGVDSASEFRAVNRAVADGVHIINMSFGSGTFDGNEYTVMQNAYKAGVALFAAAGNAATNGKSYPASYDNVCSIASSQQDGRKSNFTNYNDSVDLIFPGSDIYSTGKSGTSSYVYMSGTSMACPVAAGTAAVILSGASALPELAGKTGTEKVDALYAIMAKNAKKCPSAGTGKGTTYLPTVFNIPVSNPDDVPATPVFSLKDKTTIQDIYAVLTISCATPNVTIYYNGNGQTPSFKNGSVKNGYRYKKSFSIGGAKKVTVKAIAVNTKTGKCSKVATATYTFAPSPQNVSVYAPNNVYRLIPGSSLSLKASVYPSYATSNKVKWSVSPADKGVTVSSSGKVSVSKTATPGSYSIIAQAVDAKGNPYDKVSGSYGINVVNASSAVKSITLKDKTVTMSTNTTYNFATDMVVTYADGTKGSASDVVFSSNNNSIGSLSPNGEFTARYPGTITITATANDGSNKTATCKVTVICPVTSISIYGYNKVAAGKSITLRAYAYPYYATKRTVEWSVSGTGVTVKNGKVSASSSASGDYIVTAKATDGSDVSASMKITVVKDAIKSISMKKSMSLFTDTGSYNAPTAESLGAVISGGDSSAVTYYSSAPGIASVSSTGVVYANGVGKAKITCASTDGSNKKAVCTVSVSAPMSRLTIVPPENSDGYVCVGGSIKLTAVLNTNYGKPQNPKINWSVAPGYENLISVSNGVVKAKSLGTASKSTNAVTAVVTAEAADGSNATATYELLVIRKVTGFTLSCISGVFIPLTKLDNGSTISMPYNTIISAPKNVNIGHQETSYYGASAFYLTVDKPTTKKTSAEYRKFTPSDGVKVKVTVKTQAGGKSASQSVVLIKTADEKLYIMK